MESKFFTSIEQSKKLIELGLDPNTADMSWEEDKECDNSDYPLVQNRYRLLVGLHPCISLKSFSFRNGYIIPAWSLNALLKLMPKLYEEYNNPDDGGCQPNLCKGWDNNKWHIVYRSSIYITEWHDEPIDAAFEMVCWLIKNNHIK